MTEELRLMKKKKKTKVIYIGDEGQTIYSMASLDGKTPEEQEEFDKKRKSAPIFTGKERKAMIKAAFVTYGPMFLIMIIGFTLTALLLYLLLI